MKISVLVNSVTCSSPKLLVPDYITTMFTDQFDKCCISSAVGTDRECVGGTVRKKTCPGVIMEVNAKNMLVRIL